MAESKQERGYILDENYEVKGRFIRGPEPSKPCHTCAGRGFFVDSYTEDLPHARCPDCAGTGMRSDARGESDPLGVHNHEGSWTRDGHDERFPSCVVSYGTKEANRRLHKT